MPRILLADDSPHAQRMGERILSEEGYEVVTVSDGDSALIRLEDVDPDVVLADAIMPKRSGYEICQFIRLSPRHRRTRAPAAKSSAAGAREVTVPIEPRPIVAVIDPEQVRAAVTIALDAAMPTMID